MILSVLLVAVGVFAVLRRRGVLGSLVGVQLVSFGLAAAAIFSSARNGQSEVGSWYGLSIVVGGLIGTSVGFALAARKFGARRRDSA